MNINSSIFDVSFSSNAFGSEDVPDSFIQGSALNCDFCSCWRVNKNKVSVSESLQETQTTCDINSIWFWWVMIQKCLINIKEISVPQSMHDETTSACKSNYTQQKRIYIWWDVQKFLLGKKKENISAVCTYLSTHGQFQQ